MKRTERLLELMLVLNQLHRFTVQELADQFGVSRRTMLRDLQALSEMGVPLLSQPGLHGGYEVMRPHSLPPLSLSPEEAVGMILSYEALEAYAQSPFEVSSLSALTKLRAVLPPDVLGEVEELRQRIAVESSKRAYEAPFLHEMLQASRDQVHVEIEYRSYSGTSRRIVLPYGVQASNGFWYCPSYCYTRKDRVMLRADRITALDRRPDFAGDAPRRGLQEALELERPQNGTLLHLEAWLTEKGRQFAEWHPQLSKHVHRREDGTFVLDDHIAPAEVPMMANLLLSLGNEVDVISPPDVRTRLREEAQKIAARYADENGDRN
jgi:predicted DNA-binding transcriptional regulator YafY